MLRNRQIKRVAFISLNIDEEQSIFSALEYNSDTRFKNKLGVRPKLGLEYLCAALKKQNIESKIYDQELANFAPQELSSLMQKNNIDLVGFQAFSLNIKSITYFVQEIRKNNSIPIIAGGPGSCHYNELIKGGCDMVCFGEGEETILDIVNCYENKIHIENVEGIAYYNIETKGVEVNVPRAQIDNLDTIPFPLRTPESIKKYYDDLLYPVRKPCLTMIVSRGCLYRCSYCYSHSFWMDVYRRRSIENVIKEIRHAVYNLHIKSIEFIDDVFAVEFNWLKEFCEQLENEKFNLSWSCYLHPLSFRGQREEAFLIMKRSGCKMISFGAQSCDIGILRQVNRSPAEPEELKKAIYCAKSMGITTVACFIVGLPGETRDTVQRNFNFCLQTKPHLVFFNPLDVIPFSDLDSRYKGKAISVLAQKEIFTLCTKYTKKYYFRPNIAVRILKDIWVKNPLRLIKFITKFSYLVRKMDYSR